MRFDCGVGTLPGDCPDLTAREEPAPTHPSPGPAALGRTPEVLRVYHFFVALQYVQVSPGYAPLVAGLAVLPMIAAFALSPVATPLAARVGPGPVIIGGLAQMVLALGAVGVLVLAPSRGHE